MNDFKKNSFTSLTPSEADGDEMSLINSFALREMTPQEVFTFTVTLCDNEIDRDFEAFSVPALKKLAEMFVGKTGIADHSMKSGDQTSRIYMTWLEESETKKTKSGEPYTALKAKAYIPRMEGNTELIAKIETGIKKEVSVGCAIAARKCSVCGNELGLKPCKHVKGKTYTGKLCHTILDSPTDAYEWSFVAVPAQPAAGVTKMFGTQNELTKEFGDLSDEAFNMLTEEMARLMKLAEDGRVYRANLLSEVKRAAAIAVPGLACETFAAICESLTTEQLGVLEKAFSHRAGELIPLKPQLAVRQSIKKQKNDEFKI